MRKTLMIAALAATTGTTAPAIAQDCKPTPDFEKEMAEKWREIEVGRGLSPKGNVIRLFIGQNGSFSILRTLPNGFSCFALVGTHFEVIRAPKSATGENL